MSFVDKAFIKKFFKDKKVVIVGSAPSCLENDGKYIDKHFDIIVRVNNYKTKGFENHVGSRTDVHYAFYGSSIRKTREELIRDGVQLCMCKCPDALVVNHHEMVDWDTKNTGGDFRWIYHNRQSFWFCNTYVPEKNDFMLQFNLMGSHMPTTGFSAILTIMDCNPKELYVTGFDGFTSKKHNVDEKWRDKSERVDPICHKPETEINLIKEYAIKHKRYFKIDKTLTELKTEYTYRDIIDQYHQIYSNESTGGKVYGRSSEDILGMIAPEVFKLSPHSILDFGCGRSSLVNYFWNDGKREVYKYDPAIHEYVAPPSKKVDLVICTDVLEHIPENYIDVLLSLIREFSKRVLFTISLKRARCILPNGLNAHITIKDKEYWTYRIRKCFRECIILKEDEDSLFLKTW